MSCTQTLTHHTNFCLPHSWHKHDKATFTMLVSSLYGTGSLSHAQQPHTHPHSPHKEGVTHMHISTSLASATKLELSAIWLLRSRPAVLLQMHDKNHWLLRVVAYPVLGNIPKSESENPSFIHENRNLHLHLSYCCCEAEKPQDYHFLCNGLKLLIKNNIIIKNKYTIAVRENCGINSCFASPLAFCLKDKTKNLIIMCRCSA